MNKIEKKIKTKTKTEMNYLRYVAILILKAKTGRAKQLKLTNTIKIVSQNLRLTSSKSQKQSSIFKNVSVLNEPLFTFKSIKKNKKQQ